VVAFRLVVPFSFESIFSLMPRNINSVSISADLTNQLSFQAIPGEKASDSYLYQSYAVPTAEASADPMRIYVKIGTYIWLIGIILLLAYSFISVLHIKRHLKAARLIEANIYEANNLKTPFVMGLIKPRIYLPHGLDSEERSFILLHEQTHIHRKDNIIKVLALLIVCIHWFNPLVWIAFVLMSTDMELSCDEKVLKLLNEDIKKPYASSLLSLAAGKHILNASPLAFGEGNIKKRIKNVLSYKKPGFWLITLSIIIVAAIIIGLAVNPKSAKTPNGSSYRVKEILYHYPPFDSFSYDIDTAPLYAISSAYRLYSKETDYNDWINEGDLYPYEISIEELKALFSPTHNDNYTKAINKTKKVYRTDIPESQSYYLVIQLKDGNVLLAEGYDYERNRHISCLYKLEKLKDFDDEGLVKIIDGIRWDVAGITPQPVMDYAFDYVREQIAKYKSLGCNIVEAKITAMTGMNTGTAAENWGIDMCRLEYRLRPEALDKLVLEDGMKMEDGWLTEWSSMGQPYLLIKWTDTEDGTIWQPICVTSTAEIMQNYSTPEMLEEYGNEFTAATMELYETYKKNIEDNSVLPSEEN